MKLTHPSNDVRRAISDIVTVAAVVTFFWLMIR